MPRHLLALILVVVALASPGSLRAGEEPEAPARAYTEDDLFRFLEDEIEVTTAGQIETKISEVPQAVYVLTREEIERLHAYNIADLLRHIPGLIVANPMPSQWTVGVEAPVTISTGLVLVLVDGRSIHMPFSASNEWWSIAYAPEDIERVEVVLGPSTTVHGSQAVFGVVNFITRDAAKEGFTIKAAGGGNYGADGVTRFGDVKSHSSGVLHLGPARLRIAGGYDRLTPTDASPIYVDGRSIDVPDAQRGYGNLRAEVDLADDVELTIYAGGSGYEGPFFGFGPGIRQGAEVHADAELSLAELFTDDDELALRSYYRLKRFYTISPFDTLLPSASFDTWEHSALLRALYTAPLPAKNRLAAAVEARFDVSDMEAILPPGRVYQYYSLFVQDEFRPLDPLIFTTGLRLETQMREGLEFNDNLKLLPRASVVWLPGEGHSLRLAYGQAIFYQTAFVEYGDPQLYGGALNFYEGSPQNPDVPTHIWELGYRGQLHRSLLVTLSYGFRWIQARHWATTGEDGLLPLSFERYEEAELRHSLDATVSFRPASIARFDAAVSWLILSDRAETYAKRVSDAPAWRISARAHLSPHDRVDFDVDAHFLSSRTSRSMLTSAETEIAASFYLNARLAYRFLDDPKFEIFGSITNITDRPLSAGVDAELSDHGISRLGRRFMLGLSTEL